MNGMSSVTMMENYLQVTGGENITAASVNEFCFKNGIILTRLNEKRKSLETRFLEITGSKSDK